jgi:hypothetical protein
MPRANGFPRSPRDDSFARRGGVGSLLKDAAAVWRVTGASAASSAAEMTMPYRAKS